MENVYQQVVLTCTIINIVIFTSVVVSWIGIAISNHKKKKRAAKKDHAE